MGALTDDPAFAATTFVIIDFETTTPKGHPAQPIEVAALGLRYQRDTWVRSGNYDSLIQPPEFAPVTPADTAQTGITAAVLETAPAPRVVFSSLDRRFSGERPLLLVAQNAVTEANIIYNQREYCPRMAHANFIDTVTLAKSVLPTLPNYRLDTLLQHFSIRRPKDRHRAPADVEITAQVFLRLIHIANNVPQFGSLAALAKLAGRTAKSNLPVQGDLFQI